MVACMPDDAPATKPDADYRPLTPAQRAALDLADALEALDKADDALGCVADLPLEPKERADLQTAQEHLKAVQRSLRQRRDARGT